MSKKKKPKEEKESTYFEVLGNCLWSQVFASTHGVSVFEDFLFFSLSFSFWTFAFLFFRGFLAEIVFFFL
jgi:glucan phosphoethanolaminetransferase (alkaline phosphatase superfamily)